MAEPARVPYDPSFFRQSPLFWPVAEAAAKLPRGATWPTVSALSRLFDGEAPVRFELPTPKPRRGHLPAKDRYDARIAFERVVPTREGSWHDLLNALVWVGFPRAKLALHLRQHHMIRSRLGEDLRLPGARTKEQDAIAMFDEGGVVLLSDASHVDRAIFGHAIYEALVAGRPAHVRATGFVLTVDDVARRARNLGRADEALAGLLSREEPITRGDFETLGVDLVAARPARPAHERDAERE